jgi:hypothetical protein
VTRHLDKSLENTDGEVGSNGCDCVCEVEANKYHYYQIFQRRNFEFGAIRYQPRARTREPVNDGVCES